MICLQKWTEQWSVINSLEDLNLRESEKIQNFKFETGGNTVWNYIAHKRFGTNFDIKLRSNVLNFFGPKSVQNSKILKLQIIEQKGLKFSKNNEMVNSEALFSNILIELKKFLPFSVQNFPTYTRIYTVKLGHMYFDLRFCVKRVKSVKSIKSKNSSTKRMLKCNWILSIVI